MLAGRSLTPTIPVSDVATARVFYEEKLGFTGGRDMPDGGVMFESGGSEFGLYPTQFAGTSQATTAAWRVDDVEREVAELRERGVVFEEYDLPDFKTEGGIAMMGDLKGAWFKDPDGNILGVYQES